MPDKKPATWNDVDAALLRLCELDEERAVQEAGMNRSIQIARAAYEDGLNEIANEDARLRALVEQFAREHQADFSPAKTVERLHGILAFRTTPPAVKVLRRPWTDEERVARVREKLGGDCIRIIEELSKERVLSKAAAGEITSDQIAAAGLRIGQREVFALELKRDATPAALDPQA
jgi:phage host-nuclease inhibitor protein Gam